MNMKISQYLFLTLVVYLLHLLGMLCLLLAGVAESGWSLKLLGVWASVGEDGISCGHGAACDAECDVLRDSEIRVN